MLYIIASNTRFASDSPITPLEIYMKQQPQMLSFKRQEFNSTLDGMFQRAGIDKPVNISQNWDQVDALYTSIAQGIVEIGMKVNEAVRLINSSPAKVENGLVITVNGITSDLNAFTNDLVTIKKRHEGMGGLVKDGEELTLCLSVFSDYMELNDRFRGVIFPSMITMTEGVHAATQAITTAAIQDPTVVSDVEFKEI